MSTDAALWVCSTHSGDLMGPSRFVELLFTLMNPCLYRGLAAAMFVSAVSAPLSVRAEQVNQLEASLLASSRFEVFFSTDDGMAVTGTQISASDLSGPEVANLSDMLRVIPHALDKKQAATLYVRNIPVLTFLGDELQALSTDASSGKESLEDEGSGSEASSAPAQRAMQVAYRLDQFYRGDGSSEEIGVRWNADAEEYVIHLPEAPLAAVNSDTILPDTTGDSAEDALQATNRLRRLLGGAEPLTEITGRPAPQPVAAASQSWDVTSVFTGRASWYGPGFHGRRTASGERFNQNAMTAAHRTLPFGTRIRVTNLRNNRQVVVRVNDRGPFTGGRILDLSAGAARRIGLHSAGVGPVRIEVLD